MTAPYLLALVLGLGAATVFWLVWDYVSHLRRQLAALSQQVRELEARNDELVLALEDRADAARIDEAIRKGHMR